MSQKPNPFLRGYWNLKIVRTLSISYEDGSPHVWRNIHQSQEHLSDEELVSASCIVTSDFAVVSNGPYSVSAEVLAERDAGEGAYGVVGAVVYAIHGDDFDGRPVHIGDTYSAEAAREVVQRLSFETGYYSRCWEISSAHISHETGQYLANLADLATPEAFLFIFWQDDMQRLFGAGDAHVQQAVDVIRVLVVFSCRTGGQVGQQQHRPRGRAHAAARFPALAAAFSIMVRVRSWDRSRNLVNMP